MAHAKHPAEPGVAPTQSPRSLAIMRVLRDLGPHTTAELSRELGESRDNLAQSVVWLRKSKTYGKRVYIHDWVYEDEVSPRKYPRAQWALGDKPDKPKPKAIAADPERNKAKMVKYRERKKGLVNSAIVILLGKVSLDSLGVDPRLSE